MGVPILAWKIVLGLVMVKKLLTDEEKEILEHLEELIIRLRIMFVS
ncbi:MAG: hypothetical protein ACP6IU_01830 [Candidatus Asgardarchaeia archaeon]